MEMKEAVFNAGPFQSYWWADNHECLHPAVKAVLKQEVDPEALKKAFNEVKKLYPLIDMVPEDRDEEILFFEGEGETKPVCTGKLLKLKDKVTLFRGFSLTCIEDSITLSAFHSLVDEIGLMEIFSVLMKLYFSFAGGNGSIDAGIRENREPEEYFVQSTMLSSTDHEPKPVILYESISGIFSDPEVSNDESGVIHGKLTASAADFDAFLGKTGAEEEELLSFVMAKAVYASFPEERKKLCIGVMTDFRETFGVKGSVAPCSRKMPLLLDYQDVAGQDTEDCLKKIANIRRYQKSPDYVKSHVSMENTYAVLNLRNLCASVNYRGTFDIGEDTSRVKEISMSDYSAASLFMVRLGEEIQISFQYGKKTYGYMKAAEGVFKELGIRVISVTEPELINAETAES